MRSQNGARGPRTQKRKCSRNHRGAVPRTRHSAGVASGKRAYPRKPDRKGRGQVDGRVTKAPFDSVITRRPTPRVDFPVYKQAGNRVRSCAEIARHCFLLSDTEVRRAPDSIGDTVGASIFHFKLRARGSAWYIDSACYPCHKQRYISVNEISTA